MEILIQKFCNCCDSQYLKWLEEYLLNKKFILPSSLIKYIRENPTQTNSFYCNAIYGNESPETVKKFNQLSYHTLRLFSFVIENFPTFLTQHVSQIEQLIFKNKIEEAKDFYALIKEVALKIEDYNVLIQLNHLANKLSFSLSKSLALNENELTNYISYQFTIENLLLQQNTLIHQITLNKYEPTEKELLYFKSHFNSKSKSVNIIAKQSYLNVISASNNTLFYEEQQLGLIKKTIKQIENNSFLLIMQHKEKIMNLDYLLLKHSLYSFDDKKINQYSSKIISKWENFYADTSKLEIGLLFALSIKGSYYATNYYAKNIPSKAQLEIKEILTMCLDLKNTVNWENEGYLKYINFCNINAIYLLLDKQEEKAIKLIERTLHEYQQKQFKKLIDQLFVVLIMAYFQSKNYEMVKETFQRYKKQINKLVSIEENNLILQALYYIAQLKLSNRKQYQSKLSGVIDTLQSNVKYKSNLELVNRSIKLTNIK